MRHISRSTRFAHFSALKTQIEQHFGEKLAIGIVVKLQPNVAKFAKFETSIRYLYNSHRILEHCDVLGKIDADKAENGPPVAKSSTTFR